MQQLVDHLGRGSRVVVLRLRSMGDCVLTTPALSLLHQHRPDLHIGVAVEDRFRGIYEGLPFVHEILPPTAKDVRGFGAQLCINLHGGTRSAILTAASGARFRAGFGHYRQRFVYNIRMPRAQEILPGGERTVHTAEHIASAMFYLGVPQQPIPRAILHASSQPEPGTYSVVHPFASAALKTWPVDNFLKAMATMEHKPVVIAGPGDDITPFAQYRTYQNQPLDVIKGLISHASYFLGNDSGPAHIAAAFDVPMTVVFGPSDPAIWGPWRASQANVVTSA